MARASVSAGRQLSRWGVNGGGEGKGFHQTPADGSSSSSAEADSMKLIQVDVIRVDESDLLDC